MIRRLLSLLLLLPIAAFGGTVTGQLQTPTGGAVMNGTLTFTLSQSAILSGTASIVPATVSCYTSSTGNVVGLPDPLTTPVMATNTSSGTLAAGTYYVKIAYTGTPGDSIASPEGTVVLSAAGTVIVNAPTVQPASATGYKVYIGSTSGSETLQGTVTGWTNYSQSAALSAGAAPPATNASACSIRFSDELIPTGTYYSVNLLSRNGSQYAGYPQTWCTYGGSGGTINVSNGAPTGNCGTSGVYYPTPIYASVTTPQSVAGPFSASELDSNVNVTSGTSNFNIVNGTQFNGPLAGNTTGTHNGAVTGTTVSATCSKVMLARDVRCYTGATADIQINAAVADLPTNGGVVDARSYGASTQTIAAQIQIGNTSNKKVTLLVDDATHFDVTVNSPGNSAILLHNQSAIIGYGEHNGPFGGFYLSSTANVSSLLEVKESGVSGETETIVSDILLMGNSAATVSSAIFDLEDSTALTEVSRVGIGNFYGIGLRIRETDSAMGPINLNNLSIDGYGNAGAIPVSIEATSGTGVVGPINFFGGSFNHPGAGGLSIIQMDGGSSNHLQGVNIYGAQLEFKNATDIGIKVTNTQGFNANGLLFTNGGVVGTACIKFVAGTGTTYGATVNNITNFNNATYTIQDAISGVNLTDPRIMHYEIMPDSTGAIEEKVAPFGGAYVWKADKTGVSVSKLNAVGNDGAGFKHKRFGATTATTATANAVATTTYSWTTPFADTNYTPVCTPGGTITGTPVWQGITSFTTTGVTVQVMAATAAASSFGAVDCHAAHD